MSTVSAFLFDTTTSGANNNDDDLEKPLLIDNVDEEHSREQDIHLHLPSAPVIRRFQFLCAITGALLAYLCQMVLCAVLWRDDIYQRTRKEVVVFSVIWSLWTCLVVFAGLFLVLLLIQARLVAGAAASSKINGKKSATTTITYALDEPTLFSLEACYVVSALLTITATWLGKDLLQDGHVVSHPITTLVLLIPGYLWMARVLLKQKQPQQPFEDSSESKNEHHDPDRQFGSAFTHCMLSGILGLAVGVGSQLLIGLFLWKDLAMTKPIFSNVIGFSLLWSGCTVLLTFLACLSLRLLLPPVDPNAPHATSSTTTTTRLQSRMEATYISCTLVGICGAWIAIDCLTGLRDQVLPSMLMLGLSLFCFHFILRCFPEEHCLTPESLPIEHDDNSNNNDETPTTDMLVV